MEKKKGFTLIELLLSITIMGLIVSYLYGALGGLRNSVALLEKRDKNLGKREKLIQLLNRDILEATKVSVLTTSSKNRILELRTKNSLYNSQYVYVKWFLNLENNFLVRAEAPQTFKLPVPAEKLYLVKFDVFEKGVEKLLIYKSNKNILFSFQEMNSSKMFAIEF